jgi:hypothetical protein
MIQTKIESILKMQSKWNLAVLTIAAVLFIYLLCSYCSGLQGPFVFGDETEYGNMIHSLLTGNRLAGHQQYGPLYPILVATAQGLLPAVSNFNLARGLNIGFSFLALFPFWLLARSFLGYGKFLWLTTAVFILGPFWSFSIVAWADPLFYALFFLSFYFVHRSVTNTGRGAYFGLGLTIGLLFLAKPVGIFYLVALLISLAIVFGKDALTAKVMSRLALTSLGGLIFIAPWIYRNIAIEHTAALGYSYVGLELRRMLSTVSWQTITWQFLEAVSFQLTYILASSLGLMLVIPYLALKSWRSLTASDRILILYTILSLTIISLISALHMLVSPTLGYWIPNGRYLTQYVPLQLLLALYLWTKYKPNTSDEKIWVRVVLCIIAAMLVYAFSPLESMATFSIINNPDLSGYSRFFDGRNLVWRPRFTPDLLQRLAPVAMMLIGIIPILFFPKRRLVCNLAIFLGSIYLIGTTWHQHELIKIMSNTQRPVNSFFKGSAAPGTVNDLCAAEGIYFDESLKDANFSFIRGYWCPLQPTRYLKLEQICAVSQHSSTVSPSPPLFVTTHGNPVAAQSSIAYKTDDYIALRVSCGEKE